MHHLAHTILPISAKSPEAFTAYANQLGDFLSSKRDYRKPELVTTLDTGRKQFTEARGVIEHRDGRGWKVYRGEAMRHFDVRGTSKNLIWCFPGQGMMIDWSILTELRGYAVFAERFDAVLAGFRGALGTALFDEKVAAFLPASDSPLPSPGSHGTVSDQVLVFALQMALGALWYSQGFRPAAVIGHSVGEYPAAVFAGVLTQDEAIALVALRAQAMDSVEHDGFMCQVRATPHEITDILKETGLEVACLNTPDQTVVSGHGYKFDSLRNLCEASGFSYRKLQVAGAFHSKLMESAADSLGGASFELNGSEMDVRLFETCRCGLTPIDGLAYWSAQMRGTVDFVAAVEQSLAEVARPIFLEIGFGRTLGNFACAIARANPETDCAVVAGISGPNDVVPSTIAHLYSAGYDFSWHDLNGTAADRIVALPGYRFHKTEIASQTGAGRPCRTSRNELPALGNLPARNMQIFDMSPHDTSWLQGHQVCDAFVVPAAGMLAMMLEAAAPPIGGADLHLRDIVFEAPISLKRSTDSVRIGIQVERGIDPRIALYSKAEDVSEWTRNAIAVIDKHLDWPTLPPERQAVAKPGPSADELYARFSEQGLEYEALYKRIEDLAWTENEGLARIASLEDPARLAPLVTTLDAMLQVSDWTQRKSNSNMVLLPAAIGELSFSSCGAFAEASEVRASCDVQPDAIMVDRAGAPIISLRSIRFSSQTFPEAAPPLLVPRWVEINSPQDLQSADKVVAEAEVIGQGFAADPVACAEVDAYSEQIGKLEALVLRRMRTTVGLDDLNRIATRNYPLPETEHQTVARRRQGALAELARMALAVESGPHSRDDMPLVAKEHEVAIAAVDLLPQYLSGAMRGEDVLFGHGRGDALRAYYQNSFILRRANSAVARIVENRASRMASGQVRILEVGGGTGATTEGVLSRLQKVAGLTVDYVFTDVSRGLLSAAEKRFGHIDGFRTVSLDLNRPSAFAKLDGSFDIILGVDVVHATRDIRATVDQLASRTRSNGLFLLVEDTEKLAWVDLAFGMLDGWWDYSDDRDAHPLLDFDSWSDLLGDRFREVRSIDLCAGGAKPVVAREGLFICSDPVVQQPAYETLRVNRDYLQGYDPDILDRWLSDRITKGAREFVILSDFDRSLDPSLVNAYARFCIDLLNLAGERSDSCRIILCSRSEGMPVAGGMEGALARVAAAEASRVEVLALQLPTLDAPTVDAGIDAFLQNRGDHLNARVVDGVVMIPQLTAADTGNAFRAPSENDAMVLFGGESEIALAIARNQARLGVKRIVLAGRREARKATLSALAAIRDMGSDATYIVADVTDLHAVRAVADGLDAQRPAVLNLAGRLSDNNLQHIQPDDLVGIMEPKVRGSWNILQAFADRSADLILFSSTSVYLGNAGQAAHAMACAYLEELACAAANDSTNIKSVAWGPWKNVGITARMGLNALLSKDGEAALSTRTGLKCLKIIRLLSGPNYVAGDLTSAKLQRRNWFSALYPDGASHAITIKPNADATIQPGEVGEMPVQSVVSQVLGVTREKLHTTKSLDANGIDSLQKIEIRLGLEDLCGNHVSLSLLDDDATLGEIELAFAETMRRRSAEASGAKKVGVSPVNRPCTKAFFFEGIFGRVGSEAGLRGVVGDAVEIIALASGDHADLDMVSAAVRLADQVEQHQPDSNIILLGHSYGVALAYSVAAELVVRGRKIAHFYALDGLLAPVLSRHHVSHLGDADFQKLLLESRKDIRSCVPFDTERVAVQNLRRIFKNNCRLAASRQTYTAVDFPLTLVLPGDDNVTGITEQLFHENMELIQASTEVTLFEPVMDVIHSSGDHFSMVRLPFIRSTGEALMTLTCPPTSHDLA
ncbi:MAG: polyketide synthase dehydratase domain-containing protein [Loktanella sp.]|nr:polyketide synthase dehydratase domain-containing protein [Loktanella sp.]